MTFSNFNKSAMAASLIALSVSASAAHADVLAFAGLTGSASYADDNGGSLDETTGRIGVEGTYSYGFDNGIRLAFDVSYETQADGGNFNEAGDSGELAVHLLYGLRPDLTLGAFVSAGAAESVANEADETYPFIAVGVEGSYLFSDRLTGYAQAAYVDQPDYDTLSSGGYHSGYALRLGMSFDVTDRTSIFADAQFGGAVNYEDTGEDGEFMRLALGGETMIGSSPWAVSYGIAYESYDAIGDNNHVELATATLGLRYYFGGGRPSDRYRAAVLGTPDIMERASLFTDMLD